jgi:signal transduction histidine kinase
LLGLIGIAEKAEKWEEIREYLGMMRDRVKTMDAFIREITDYSRNSRLDISLEPVPLYSLIKGVVENLRFMDESERIKVEINIPHDNMVVTDMARIRVVVSNLVSNAMKYHDLTKDRPFIKISYASKNGSHILSIEENGQGIRKEHQNKIFNMFYRASENSDGSGLGLYIVKETIEKLAGQIEVNSEYGKGSIFTVKLPLN